MELALQHYLIQRVQLERAATRDDTRNASNALLRTEKRHVLSRLQALRKHGCPWNLDAFYKRPAAFSRMLNKWLWLQQQLPGAVLRALCADETCEAESKKRRFALKRLLQCEPSAALALLRADRTLLGADLAAAAARYPKRQLHALRKLGCPWDGRVWWNAAHCGNYGALELASKQRCPWIADKDYDWSALCRLLDAQWLHDQGTPCRKRHSARLCDDAPRDAPSAQRRKRH
jgi:hypothetical protein